MPGGGRRRACTAPDVRRGPASATRTASCPAGTGCTGWWSRVRRCACRLLAAVAERDGERDRLSAGSVAQERCRAKRVIAVAEQVAGKSKFEWILVVGDQVLPVELHLELADERSGIGGAERDADRCFTGKRPPSHVQAKHGGVSAVVGRRTAFCYHRSRRTRGRAEHCRSGDHRAEHEPVLHRGLLADSRSALTQPRYVPTRIAGSNCAAYARAAASGLGANAYWRASRATPSAAQVS